MSGLERKPALPPRRSHPIADLVVPPSTSQLRGRSNPDPDGIAGKPVKDQLNVRIRRDVAAQLDHAILVLSARRGTKLTKAEAVEEAIRAYLAQQEVSG